MIGFIKKKKLLSFIVLIYVFLFIFKMPVAITAIGNSGYYLIEMFKILPVIFMLTVAIDLLVPKDWIVKRLGSQSGFLGGFLALAFGSLSAGPIYAAFPIAKMLHKKGASVRNIVIILSAWAVIKVPMLANESKFLGPDFMLARWGLTVLSIILIGWIMERFNVQIEDSTPSQEGSLSIQQDYCIGCGICQKSAPHFYKMEKGKAYVTAPLSSLNTLKQGDLELIKKTVEKCPSKAISLQEN